MTCRIQEIQDRLDRWRDYVPTRWAYLNWRGSGKQLVELPEYEDEHYLYSRYGVESVYLDVDPTPDEIAEWRADYLRDLELNRNYQDLRYLLGCLGGRVKRSKR